LQTEQQAEGRKQAFVDMMEQEPSAAGFTYDPNLHHAVYGDFDGDGYDDVFLQAINSYSKHVFVFGSADKNDVEFKEGSGGREWRGVRYQAISGNSRIRIISA